MLNYLVIGTCLFLLILVVYIAAKPISMGIEARRNFKQDEIKEDFDKEEEINSNESQNEFKNNSVRISEEIIKLNELKNDGLLTQEEYEIAKKKLLS